MQWIYLPGSFLAFFLGLLIISKKHKGKHDYVLALWFACIAIHIAIFQLIAGGHVISPKVMLSQAAFPLLQGPFLYVYTGLLLKKVQADPRIALHLAPFIITCIIVCMFPFEKIEILTIAGILSGSIYLVLAYRMLMTTRLPHEKLKYKWLKLIIGSLCVLWSIFLLTAATNHWLGNEVIHHEFIYLSVNFFVFAIGFWGLKEGYILANDSPSSRYTSSPLEVSDLDMIRSRLESLFAKQKLYLDPDLNLQQLADQLQVPPHHLSQLFSSVLKTNYYDLINQYRIAEVLRKLDQNEIASKSLLGIALESGFKSKSTFNRAFKKHIGKSPTDYLKSNKGVPVS